MGLTPLVLIGLAGSVTACTTAQVPAFLHRDEVSAARLSCVGAAAVRADSAHDNLNELLNLLHLGRLTAGDRTGRLTVPHPACTAVLYAGVDPVLSVAVPAGDTVHQVYLRDLRHPARNGRYRLRQPIGDRQLREFLRKYEP